MLDVVRIYTRKMDLTFVHNDINKNVKTENAERQVVIFYFLTLINYRW
jgi:Cu2+-containing amine oxidase